MTKGTIFRSQEVGRYKRTDFRHNDVKGVQTYLIDLLGRRRLKGFLKTQ
jgi:hypothetical protein